MKPIKTSSSTPAWNSVSPQKTDPSKNIPSKNQTQDPPVSSFSSNVVAGNYQDSGMTPNIAAFPEPVISTSADQQLQRYQEQVVQSALQEWENEVVEEPRGSNQGPRIQDYANRAGGRCGGEWCGFFAGFNYDEAGFQHTSSLASDEKARSFFVYREHTDHSDATHRELDALRLEHESQGSSRQYFMLGESQHRQYFSDRSRFDHFDVDAHTFTYDNLPIRAGDVVLFNHNETHPTGHVGLVLSYDAENGRLITLEGNSSGEGPNGSQIRQGVARHEYDLTDPAVREQFAGFGRPALGDFAP